MTISNERMNLLSLLLNNLESNEIELNIAAVVSEFDIELSPQDKTWIDNELVDRFEYKRDHLDQYYTPELIARLTNEHYNNLILKMFADPDADEVISILEAEVAKLQLNQFETDCLLHVMFRSF